MSIEGDELSWIYREAGLTRKNPPLVLQDILGAHVRSLAQSTSEPSVDEISDQLKVNRATVYKTFHALYRVLVKEYMSALACKSVV